MTTTPETSRRSQIDRTHRSRLFGVIVTLASLLLLAAGWHLAALAEYDAAASSAPTARRLASAQLALRLEPWNQPFAWRVVALEGLALLQKGQVDNAYFLVEPYSQVVQGKDATFVAIYQEIVRIKTPIDSGKAHVAHGLDPLNDFGTTATAAATPAP